MAGLLETIRGRLERERNVRLVASDPALTAELLLLFRVILADGQVRGEELDTFKRICRQAFGLEPEAMDGVYRYLQDFGYETSDLQSTDVFRDLPMERRKALLEHMIAVAQADHALDVREMRLLERTADALGFDLKGGPG
ncbi:MULTISPECIES: TerB family tellurite resistance protein [unclassified Roseitalea]|uniref:tellurite resistance TerB family protein n=1 Tax=unclassified Roseitalea TaxID=2639107 RepID=UPI00273D3BB3|nr:MULTISPECIES: TerB family tellurite resistance protein [unclassified Roseitalea]